MTKQKCNHSSIAKGVGENFYSCIMCGEKVEQIKECPTCKTLKESKPTPDGDEVCSNCGDREMMDKEITYVGRKIKNNFLIINLNYLLMEAEKLGYVFYERRPASSLGD